MNIFVHWLSQLFLCRLYWPTGLIELPIFFFKVYMVKRCNLSILFYTDWTCFQVTYHFFHWKKGTPFAEDQGVYNALTWWEQIDNGKQLTRNRKFLTVVPLVLWVIILFISTFDSEYYHFSFIKNQNKSFNQWAISVRWWFILLLDYLLVISHFKIILYQFWFLQSATSSFIICAIELC